VDFTGFQAQIDSPQRMGNALVLFETDIQVSDVKQMMIF
jgi:hypothetical protein